MDIQAQCNTKKQIVIKWQSHPTYYTHNSDKQKENQIVSSHYFESIHTKNSQKTYVLYVLRQNHIDEIKQNDNTTNYHNNAHNHTYDL